MFFLVNFALSGQIKPLERKKGSQPKEKARIEERDSIPDQRIPPTDSINIPISKDALQDRVEYHGQDSMISDVTGQQLLLYGEGSYVKYQDLNITAGFIRLNLDSNIVTATYELDSLGNKKGIPDFSQGDQKFTSEKMRYNYQTGKGKVYDITTQQNDVIVKGSELKFIRNLGDTSQSDILYTNRGIFTTCTHDEPHFGIRTSRQKLISEKLVITGPANLEIMGVPTPLVLPFAFFPVKQGRQTGLLFPRDYEYSQQWGFGLRDIGWFFPLGENFNLTLRNDIYLKGTYGIKANLQYNKRYRYSGNLNLGFDNRRSENNEGEVLRQPSFSFSWSHQQAQAAHPTNKFGGSINMQFFNDYQGLVNNDARNVLNNSLNSNFGFSKTWRGKPYNLNIKLSHSQNRQTNRMDITFPNVRFSTGSLYPFKSSTGGSKWTDNIVINYTGEARNQLSGQADSFFIAETFDNARVGIRNNLTASTSFKLLKYFSLNPSVNYEEVWNFKRVNYDFDPTATVRTDTIFDPDDPTIFQVVNDTTDFGEVVADTVWQFAPFRQYSFNIGLTTQIFGTVNFNSRWLRGIRHTIKPSIGFSFSPNYLSEDLGYYQELQTDSRFPDRTQTFSTFSNGVFGAPSRSGQRMALTYSFRNIIEAKYLSRKDTVVEEKKLKLFDNLNVSGSYNFAADSLQFSQISINGATRFFKGVTTLRFSATYDPYAANENGQRINKFAVNETGQLLRFVNANVRIANNLTVSKIRALFQGKEEPLDDGSQATGPGVRPAKSKEEDLLSLFENFSIGHNMAFRWEKNREQRDTFRITTNTINIRGSVRLTDNWNINVGNIGYDFVRKDISYPSLGFSRDLHCWELGLNWQPTRGTYSFFIRVKPGTLDFISLPYQQNNADARRAF